MNIALNRIQMYFVALLITVTTLVHTYSQKRTDKGQNKLFIGVNFVLLVNILTSIADEFLKLYPDQSEVVCNIRDMLQYCYFIVHSMLCPFFTLYVFRVVGKKVDRNFLKNMIVGMLFFLSEFVALSNPITHWVYVLDNGVYKRQDGLYLIYVSAAFYFLYSLVMLFRSWYFLTSRKRISILYFFILVASGVLVQMLYIEIRSEMIAEAIGFMGVMIAIENEDARKDGDTDFYNRKALINDFKSYIANNWKLNVLNLRVINPEIIRRATGSSNYDLISVIIGDYLKSVVPRYYIYVATSESFIIVIPDDSGLDAKETAKDIIKRFEEPFGYGEIEMRLNAVILMAEVPGTLMSGDAVLDMAEQELPKEIDKKILSDSDLDYLLRRNAVVDAVNRGLSDKRFEVYYQPTFHADGRLHGAEALIRLHDSISGMIYPDEFIPAAEQLGFVGELDNYVFENVCALIESGVLKQYDLECINVNLSVLHCMQPDFLEKLNAIGSRYEIDKKCINFEITESASSSDYELLADIVDSLKKEGYGISLDDYGTGYSNMQTVASLDFDVVKIDKSILWNAAKNDIGMIVLENTIHMVKRMGRKVLVEGVETKSQVELLRRLSVEYLQGFLFSRAVPKDEFLRFIEDYNSGEYNL